VSTAVPRDRDASFEDGSEIVFHPIGRIHSGHTKRDRTPIQPVYAYGCPGVVEVYPKFEAGLADLEGFSHLFLLYHFDRAGPLKLTVKPFLQDREHGLFATRSPSRPNAIGLSIVELIRREGRFIHCDGLDIFDGTPLLDIKPVVSRFDSVHPTRNGWQDEVDEETARKIGIKKGEKDG